MKRTLVAYVTVVSVAAILLSALIVALHPVELQGLKPWLGVAALVFLMVAGDGFGVRVSGGRAVFSISLIPAVAMVPLFGPSIAVLSRAFSQILAQTFILKRPAIKSIFNAAQFSLATGLGSLVYVAMGGPVDYEHFDVLHIAVALGGLITVYFFANMLLVGAVLSLDTGKRVSDIWRQLGPVAFTNEVASSSYSLFIVFAFTQLGVFGLLVGLLPLFTVHHAYGVQYKLVKQNREILEFTIKTIEAKDPYTSGHSHRVASLSHELAESLNLSAQAAEEVETSALLHDIGKIDFAYAELISSPAKLTEAEREIIRSHPDRGARLLTSISSLGKGVLAAVRHHHEHYDGNGYPEGLAGEEIPLTARIIMVVDTVDAMLSDRPYRAALTTEEVTAELRRFSGRQFDPVIAALFIERGLVEKAARMAEADRTPLPLSISPHVHVSVS